MQENKEIYNHSYRQFTPEYIQSKNISKIEQYMQQNRDSLVRFLTSYQQQFDLTTKISKASVLELGCGIGSFSFNLNEIFNEYQGIDISELAIATASEVAKIKDKNLKLQVVDVCSDFELGRKFDFIIDSHLYHCLTQDNQRQAYLDFVKRHLAPTGIFMAEMMVFWPKLQAPVGYEFDENFVLHQSIGQNSYPIRKIARSIDIEQEMKASKMNINYLYYHNELAFNPFSDYQSYPEQFLPRTLRLSTKLC